MAEPCVFCEIVHGHAPAEIVERWPDAIAIRPLNPVVDGHLLVLPLGHVRDAFVDPAVTATVFQRAAQIGQLYDCDLNLITSAGAAATQSVWHLHVHLVPRSPGDGLALPWYSGKRRAKGGEQYSPPPCCPDCGMPETNCACG